MLGDTVVGELQLKQIDHDKKEYMNMKHLEAALDDASIAG